MMKISHILVFFALFTGAAFSQSTAFNYQGKLSDGGSPANGSYQLQFKLFDALAGGSQIGATITDVAVTASQGVFSAQLDFGASAFTGSDRFLEVAVRRNSGQSYTTLSPREKIASSPYSLRTLSAAQADLALDSNKLGGLNAGEYVTTATVGSAFIKNDTALQTANFNISGNGTLGNLGIGIAPQAGWNLDLLGTARFQTPNGNVNFSTPSGEMGMTYTNANRADLRFDGSTLKLLAGTGTGSPPSTNGITINTFGNVGIGTTTPSTARLTVSNLGYGLGHTGGSVSLASYIDSSAGWFGTRSNTPLNFFTNDGGAQMTLLPNGNIGMGAGAPNTRLTLSGGPLWTSNNWTASMNMQNGSALGWEANSSGQRFGIGQSTGGLFFFRTNSAFGSASTPANYDMQITDSGNVVQARDKGGIAKAMIYVDPFLPASQYIVRCYNGVTGSSSGNCGFSVTRIQTGRYIVDFGFQVNDRFFSLSGGFFNVTQAVAATGTNTVEVTAKQVGSNPADLFDTRFHLIVY